MPEQHDACPPEQGGTLGGIAMARGRVGEAALLPHGRAGAAFGMLVRAVGLGPPQVAAGQPAATPARHVADLGHHAGDRQHELGEPLHGPEHAREPHLQIEFVVDGVLMMAHVAGAKVR